VLDILISAWLSGGEKLTTHELDDGYNSVSLFTHAFQADRREQGRALDEGAAEQDEGSAKESSREVTTNSHCENPVAAETKASAIMVNTPCHLELRQVRIAGGIVIAGGVIQVPHP